MCAPEHLRSIQQLKVNIDSALSITMAKTLTHDSQNSVRRINACIPNSWGPACFLNMRIYSMFCEDINYSVFYFGTVLKWMTLWFQVCVAGIEYVFGLSFCECCLLIPPPPPIFFNPSALDTPCRGFILNLESFLLSGGSCSAWAQSPSGKLLNYSG
jgi:hypothetical protein